jgi:hypothetical protein
MVGGCSTISLWHELQPWLLRALQILVELGITFEELTSKHVH